jgi:hypothetical protein
MINFDPFSQWPLWILAKEIAEPTGSKSSQVRVHQRQISRQEPWVWDHRLTVLTGHIWQNEDVWKNSASFWDNPELGQFWPLFIGWLIHLQKIRQPMWVEGSLVDIVVVDPFPDPCKARGPWLKIRLIGRSILTVQSQLDWSEWSMMSSACHMAIMTFSN